MTSLFDVEVSVGERVERKLVSTMPLGRERFDTFNVYEGDPNDKDGLYYCPALMRADYRSTDAIKHVALLVLDIDKMPADEMPRMFSLLEKTEHEYILHTTLSHTEEKPRYRLIFNPSRPLTAIEYKCVMPQLATAFGVTSHDPHSETACQPMFYPMVMKGSEGTERFTHHPGTKVDVEPYVLAMITADVDEDYTSKDADNQPMAIPGALDEGIWFTCILKNYPASSLEEYSEWTDVGMALYHQTDGRAFDTWLEWTRLNKERHGKKKGIIKTEHEMQEKKWPSFLWENKKREDKVTLRKILNNKTDNGRKVLALAYKSLLEMIDEPAHLKRLLVDIKDEKFLHDADYKIIAPAYKDTYKRLMNDDMSIGEVMMIIRPEFADTGRKEYFANHYLFSEGEAQYYEISSKDPVSIVSMNYMYGSSMPASNSGERKVVHKVLTNETNGYVKPRVMHGKTYEVGGEAVVNDGSRTYLNVFQPSSWPYVDRQWDEEHPIDERIKAMIHSHLGLLCNGDKNLMRMLIQHLGHLRQKPMQRLHFAYAISSTFHGAGKSTLRRLYSTVLGTAQVNLLSAGNIAEDFNAYAAAPYLMSFIEEFEFGTRREQNLAIKKMKDLITSDTVSVRRMRRDAQVAKTYTAYAIFSNDEYVLGHESTGRRWIPIIVEAVNATQCSERLGQDHEQFYIDYHALMDTYPERFVAYFNQVTLEGFKTERPPESARKQQFIENIPQARCLRVIQELIEDEKSIDLTADYACGNSAFQLVRSYLEFNDSADVDELRHFDNRQLRHLVERSLREAGYEQAGPGTERLRLPFDMIERTRMNDVWVKSKQRYGGSEGIRKLRRRILEDKRQRLSAMTGGSVVMLNPGTNNDDDDDGPSAEELASL